MEAAVKRFFQSQHFAVAGASNDANKFGYKRTSRNSNHRRHGPANTSSTVLAWYIDHSLPVTPINPRSPQILDYPTVAAPSKLQSPQSTSLSIVTPPAITLAVLKEAQSVGISSVWMQPGSYDQDVLSFANQNFETVVAGEGGRGHEGLCVLVDGEWGLDAAGVKWTSQRL